MSHRGRGDCLGEDDADFHLLRQSRAGGKGKGGNGRDHSLGHAQLRIFTGRFSEFSSIPDVGARRCLKCLVGDFVYIFVARSSSMVKSVLCFMQISPLRSLSDFGASVGVSGTRAAVRPQGSDRTIRVGD